MHVKGAHFLEEDVALFDAGFFGMASDFASVCILLLVLQAGDGTVVRSPLIRTYRRSTRSIASSWSLSMKL